MMKRQWQRIWQPASRREAVPEAVVRAAAARLLPHRQRKLFRQRPVWDSGRCSCVWFRRWQGSLTERICCWQRTVLPLPVGDFHARYMKGKVTVIGCPKLDPVDYSEKLTEIFRLHNIRSVTLVRMEVPCCGGLERAVQKALAACGRPIPFESVTLSVRGEIL